MFGDGPTRPNGVTYPTPEELRIAYDNVGIEKGVIMTRLCPENMHVPVTSRDAQMMYDEYRNTFAAWFCGIDPRMVDGERGEGLSHYLGFYRERGAIGVGEIHAAVYIDDPRMMTIYHNCQKCDMAITLHLSKPGKTLGVMDDLGLVRLEKILEEFPKLKFFGHAQGFWSAMGDDLCEENQNGYPDGKINKPGRITELMRKYPNLLCDLSGKSGLNALTRDPEFAYKFIEEFHDRIFFATDITGKSPLPKGAKELCDFLDDSYDHGYISREAYENVCRENALRMIK